MISSSSAPAPCPELPPSTPATDTAAASADAGGRAYGVPFWTAYVANTLVTVALALLFRYADFITLLGGTEFHLGWIVGVGMVGSVSMRLVLGSGIDHHGPRRIWILSLVALALACVGHLGIHDYSGVSIYLLRIVFCTALAGIFGASTTFISGGASAERMAKLIGMLGTSGFLGMMLGTQLGDLLCGTPNLERWQVDQMFGAAGLLAACAIPFAWWATRRQLPPVRERRPPMTWLLRHHQPGMILLVGILSGATISMPATFLRPFAAELGISKIGLFFAVCAAAAVTTRILTRGLPERLGLPPLVLFGLAMMAVSQCLFLLVRSQWQLVVPGLAFGIAQGVLFPMVTAAGSSSFPGRHRGLGITLILAAFDLGPLVGAPIVGMILQAGGSLGFPGYPTVFLAMAGCSIVVAALYAVFPTRDGQARSKLRRYAGARND